MTINCNREVYISVSTGAVMHPNPLSLRYRMPAVSWSLAGVIFFFMGWCAPAASSSADREALDDLQRKAIAYMWDGADRETGMAYEASFPFPGEGRPLAVGGTGFGAAALVTGVHRGWIERPAAAERLLRMVRFLRDKTPRRLLHGAFPHWLHHETGEVLPFGELDDGADLVETALLMQGLLIARGYFDGDGADERELREIITVLWEDVDWAWFADRKDGGLYWHWSPVNRFGLGMKIQGFNECLIAYILALGSPTHPVDPAAYAYWTAGDGYRTRRIHGYEVEASLPGAGPLFLAQYSFIGLDPARMADRHVPNGYLVRNIRHTLANRGYCLYDAPREHGYGPGLWGLTASMTPDGYAANDPGHDTGTVAPTAALSSMPYVPQYAFDVLHTLRGPMRRDAWREYGPVDAVNPGRNWAADGYLAIDQLPIPCMIENYRSGLLWRLFMAVPEVTAGLRLAGMAEPDLAEGFPEAAVPLRPSGAGYVEEAVDLRPHPDRGVYEIPYWSAVTWPALFTLRNRSGETVWMRTEAAVRGRNRLAVPTDAGLGHEPLVLTMDTGSDVHSLAIALH